MDDAKIRDDFEKFYLGGNKSTARRNKHGDYLLPSIQDAWGGWRLAYELTWETFMREATKTPSVERNRPGGGFSPEGPVDGSGRPHGTGKDEEMPCKHCMRGDLSPGG